MYGSNPYNGIIKLAQSLILGGIDPSYLADYMGGKGNMNVNWNMLMLDPKIMPNPKPHESTVVHEADGDDTSGETEATVTLLMSLLDGVGDDSEEDADAGTSGTSSTVNYGPLFNLLQQKLLTNNPFRDLGFIVSLQTLLLPLSSSTRGI